MFKLNKDILLLIFEELQDDSMPLYSSLLVNKFWLETVIPILWKNPWRYVDLKSQSKISLYNILIFFLSENSKEFLTSQGIILPSTSNQSLIFDYLSFCRSINVDVVNNILSIGSSSAYNQYLLQQEIYNLFMRRCPQLKYLDMISLKHQLFYFPEAKICLESLGELICETATDDSYFYGLASICQNIQRLVILNTRLEGNLGIVVLIEVQKNLKSFEWKDNLSFDYYIEQFSYKDNFMALKKKADTLIHFAASFYDFPNNNYYDNNTTFPPELLPELYNLKALKFNTPFFSKRVYEIQLKLAIYSNLEILQIDYISSSTITSIIKNSGGKLKKILTNKQALYEENFYDDSLNYIRAVYDHCPLVEYLSLGFPSSLEHFLEFENLLKACPKLKVLILEIESTSQLLDERFKTSYWQLPGIPEKRNNIVEKDMLMSGEKLLNALIRSAPISLRELRFYSSFKFSLITLEEFLENWRGRPALTIYTLDRVYETENYVKIIEKYVNEGVIEDFLYGSIPIGDT